MQQTTTQQPTHMTIVKSNIMLSKPYLQIIYQNKIDILRKIIFFEMKKIIFLEKKSNFVNVTNLSSLYLNLRENMVCLNQCLKKTLLTIQVFKAKKMILRMNKVMQKNLERIVLRICQTNFTVQMTKKKKVFHLRLLRRGLKVQLASKIWEIVVT